MFPMFRTNSLVRRDGTPLSSVQAQLSCEAVRRLSPASSPYPVSTSEHREANPTVKPKRCGPWAEVALAEALRLDEAGFVATPQDSHPKKRAGGACIAPQIAGLTAALIVGFCDQVLKHVWSGCCFLWWGK